jgi:hypothetical protein
LAFGSGIFKSTKKESDNLKSIKLTTVGFSYDINSKSLFDMAEYTNSCFNFIPDASMVGTSFCNYLANILCPDISIPNITKLDNYNNTLDNFDSLSFEQQYELIRYHCYETLKETCIKSGNMRRLGTDVTLQLEQFKKWILSLPKSNLLSNMIKDFISIDDSQEQITKAIQRTDWFNKWGYHYLLSLSLAHFTRMCHNFKDQGVQLYGNSVFKDLQDQVYQVFSSIQPPKPSLNAQVVRSSMSAYVNASGGCFSPECRIKLVDGSFCSLNKLVGNEIVYQEDLPGAKIKYIVITKIQNSQISMCKVDNLIISDYHPVFDTNSNGWVFPNQLVTSTIHNMDYMYNIVLESGYWVNIEGFKCVTLGHNLKNFDSTNMILNHDYFGTQQVIDDIEQFKVDSNKIITLDNYNIIRSVQTNRVIKTEKL